MARPDTRITNYTSENIAEFQMVTGGTEHDLPSPISTLFRRWVPSLLPSIDHCPRPQQAEQAFHLSSELLSQLDACWMDRGSDAGGESGRFSGTSSLGSNSDEDVFPLTLV
jgi:hypothetical protein